MSMMTGIGFAIYLLALLLAPLIAAFRVGVGAALRMAFAEVVIVVASWLLIPVFVILANVLLERRENFAGVISVLNESITLAVLGSMLYLLAIPLLSIVAGLLLAWVGLAFRAIWRGLQ